LVVLQIGQIVSNALLHRRRVQPIVLTGQLHSGSLVVENFVFGNMAHSIKHRIEGKDEEQQR
jgi:hypothetical protein